MKVIDCEFHYYLPELMDYLATRDKAMRYYPETKVLEVRDKVYAHFGGVTHSNYMHEHLHDEKYILS